MLRAPAEHAGATYVLTGPEALTLTEVAARAGAVLGRELRFEDETVEAAYASRKAAYGAEDWQLDAWVSTYTAIKDGSCAEVTDDVERVTGHPARTLEQVRSRGRVVHVAPAPVLAGLGGLHHRVGGLVEVLGGVLADRGVAAGDVAALEALAQRDPLEPLVEAALADGRAARRRPG